MHNPGHIVILSVCIHNVVYKADVMVSVLVNISTAEKSLNVTRNTDLSTSLTYINIASIHSSGSDETLEKPLCLSWDFQQLIEERPLYFARKKVFMLVYILQNCCWLLVDTTHKYYFSLEFRNYYHPIYCFVDFVDIDNMFPLKQYMFST